MESKCSVCLLEDVNLIKAAEEDANSTSFLCKLNSCVPEVEWNEEHLICRPCIDQLEIACAFRSLCLQSTIIRKKQWDTIQKTERSTSLKHGCDDNVSSSSKETVSCEGRFGTICKENVPHSQQEAGEDRKFYTSTDSSASLYICFHCNEHFINKVILVAHLRTKHNSGKLTKQCHSCQNTFINQTALENHQKEDHSIDQERTEISQKEVINNDFLICNTVGHFNDSEQIKIEIEENSLTQDSDAVLMSKIDEAVNFKSASTRHNRRKLTSVSTSCHICGMVFTTRYLARRHVRNVHATEKKYQCDMCEQKFASPVYLSAHKRYHSGKRSHICSFCGKGFITGSDLYHHEKIHANKRAYKCDKCPKAFNTSSDLHKHKLCVHQDRSEWKYVCNFCERRFPLKTNLDAHIKTHTGERNFACHLCERRCVNRSVLLRHIKSHSNVRLFKCNLCNAEYKYQKSLDIHMTKVHGIGNAKVPDRIKKYFCHICPKGYFANNKLQKHIRTHTGERPFSCQLCEKTFIDKSYVKQHLKSAHNIYYL